MNTAGKVTIAIGLALSAFVASILTHQKDMADFAAIKPDTLRVVDTLWVSLPSVVYRDLPAKHDTIYQAFFPGQAIEVASTEAISPRGDTVSVEYIYRPIDKFNFSFRPAPFIVPVEYREVVRTAVYQKVFLGPYFKVGMFSPWLEGIGNLSTKRFTLSAGFALAFGNLGVDLEPINLWVENSKADVGFSIEGRYYPWAQ